MQPRLVANSGGANGTQNRWRAQAMPSLGRPSILCEVRWGQSPKPYERPSPEWAKTLCGFGRSLGRVSLSDRPYQLA